MDVMYANLHMHSGFSDAGFSPEQLVRIGKALGYKAMALTDHETDAGCDEFLANCAIEGIEGITGAEFYGRFNGRNMHITALDFDRTAPRIRNFIDERCRLQTQWSKLCFDKLKAMGKLDEITWDEVLVAAGKGAWVCYDSVLNVMAFKHLLTPERRAEIVEVYLRDPDLKPLKPQYPDAVEIFQAVREAGGVVGVAHPKDVQFDYMEQLIDYGMNGIEISYNAREEASIRGREMAFELAERRKLYKMGGSDHSGPLSANGGIYAMPVTNGISEEDYRILKDRRLG